jgi:hypothetical protein
MLYDVDAGLLDCNTLWTFWVDTTVSEERPTSIFRAEDKSTLRYSQEDQRRHPHRC